MSNMQAAGTAAEGNELHVRTEHSPSPRVRVGERIRGGGITVY